MRETFPFIYNYTNIHTHRRLDMKTLQSVKNQKGKISKLGVSR